MRSIPPVVFSLQCRQTNTQTHTNTDTAKNPTHAQTIVGVGNENHLIYHINKKTGEVASKHTMEKGVGSIDSGKKHSWNAESHWELWLSVSWLVTRRQLKATASHVI